MRYIGNKTRLLDFIRDVLSRRGIRGGVAVDPFTGTASVARALKRRGFRVIAADIMEYAYIFGRAYVEVSAEPDFSRLAPELDGAPPTLGGVVAHLNRLPPDPGFLHEQFSPEGAGGAVHGRRYFTPENAARIDAVRATLHRWREAALLDDDGYHVLLASLLEAADRVANTTGVYAAFVKSWQPNALRPLTLEPPRLLPGNGCRAVRCDALELARDLPPFELLYLDPPYNTRQYPGYYHIPELIATGWFDARHTLRGKTGLPPDADKRSDWARRARCEEAFATLVATAPWRRLVMSYNTEGIIPASTIERV